MNPDGKNNTAPPDEQKEDSLLTADGGSDRQFRDPEGHADPWNASRPDVPPGETYDGPGTEERQDNPLPDVTFSADFSRNGVIDREPAAVADGGMSDGPAAPLPQDAPQQGGKDKPKKFQLKQFPWENYVLRLFSAWCLSAFFFCVMNNGSLSLDVAAKTSIVTFAVVFALNFGLLSLLRLIRRRSVRMDAAMLAASFSLFAFFTVLQADSWYYSLGLSAVAALFVWYCVRKGWLRLKNPFSVAKKRGAAALMCGVFVLIVGVAAVTRYKSFTAPNYDFGIFCQMFYNMRKSLQPFTTSERDMLLSHFAIHLSPIFYVLLPLYSLFPSPVTLELVQPLILGSAVLPVMLLAKHFGLSNTRTALVCFMALFHPAVVSGTNYDLHENCFLLPLLLWVFYFFETQRPVAMAVFTVLTLTVKEDAAVYIVFFALFALFGKSRPWTAAAMAFGAILYFLCALYYLTVYGNGVMANRYENYLPMGGTLVDVVKNVLVAPGYVFTQLFVDKQAGYAAKMLFLLQMFVPLAFAPFAVKKVSRLLLLLPMVLMNLMTVYPYQYDIGFQYHFGVLAFLIYLSVLNLAEMPKVKAKTFLAIGAALTALLFTASAIPRAMHFITKYTRNSADYAVMNEALEQIPDDASVICSTYLLPKLCARDEIYEDWYHVTDENEDADYVILDMRYDYSEYRQQYEELGYTNVRIVSNGNTPLLCIMQRE